MFHELKTLIAIKKYGSFSATGHNVGLTQAAVSAQIKSLESYLGIKLFERNGKTVQFNSEGLRVLALAEQVFELVEKMKQPECMADFTGEIRIGAIASIQSNILPEILEELFKYFPKAKIKLIPGVSFNLFHQLGKNEIDLAIIIKPNFEVSDDYCHYTLKKEPILLITPIDIHEKHPVEILKNNPFIRYDYSSFGGKVVANYLNRNQIKTNDIIEVDEIEAIIRMVEKNLGVALIPDIGMNKLKEKNINIIDLKQPDLYREIIIIHKKNTENSIISSIVSKIVEGVAIREK
ncbi:LysR family transcriptional regulator [Acinetobacter calcoaceticus]|uniref:LysR family transcriptional regulator n=1 Tax=Acinetobacter calcoaceticus TaxID=471 RepID=UPI00124C02A8|nr:LysR family transcriptional regulator [Acinetobacter calcoaceticus]